MALIPGIDYPVQIVIGPLTINDNQMVQSVLFSLPISSSPNIVVEYSIIRGAITEVGRIMVSTNGSAISLSDDNTGTNNTGVFISSSISGSNLQVQYLSSSLGYGGQFWYTIRNITN